MHAAPCPVCDCRCNDATAAHAIVAALAHDDLDLAIERGLLGTADCAGCTTACRRRLADSRDARVQALAARDRHRTRNQRLQQRDAERTAKRAAAAQRTAALPPAAAAALARARARVAKP